ncbi:LysR family transcriptional regulator [Klenkia sp. LSe6-5]|uniref:LysR family transcriptional regulator n=1 Tax=Klenkia sesuvii TaxID=3103137 RepID=A0ABU8DR65_9ACTN
MVPHFSLRQLAYLVAVAEAGSMTSAAEAQHVSQAAISTGITDLERHLGVQLLVRRPGHGVSLTEAGAGVVADARRALAAAADVQVRARAPHADLRGPVTLGCYRTMAPHHIPALHQDLQRLHPALELSTVEGGQEELRRALTTGACDVLLTYEAGLGPGLHTETLVRPSPYVLLAADHPLAGRPTIRITELADDTLVQYSPGPGPLGGLHVMHEAGVLPRRVVESTEIEVVRSLVARGVGYAILLQVWPTPLSIEGLPLAAVHLESGVPDHAVVLARLPDRQLGRRAQAVVELLRSAVPARFNPTPGSSTRPPVPEDPEHG